MEQGTVKRFDGRPEKNFGFLTTSKGDVFFHLNDASAPRGTVRTPRIGDTLTFIRKHADRGPKAMSWSFVEEKPSMTLEQMRAVIDEARPGDKLRLVFANKTFDGDLKGRLYMILIMQAQTIDFGVMPLWNLKAVADSGRWEGMTTYTITILDGFDPEHFANRTLGRSLLESIEKVGDGSTIKKVDLC